MRPFAFVEALLIVCLAIALIVRPKPNTLSAAPQQDNAPAITKLVPALAPAAPQSSHTAR